MAEQHAAGRPPEGPGREPGAYQWFAKKVGGMVGEARERGIGPDSAEAAHVLDRLLGPADRTQVLARLEAGDDARTERYRQLLATVNGDPAPSSHLDDFAWLAAALRAHP